MERARDDRKWDSEPEDLHDSTDRLNAMLVMHRAAYRAVAAGGTTEDFDGVAREYANITMRRMEEFGIDPESARSWVRSIFMAHGMKDMAQSLPTTPIAKRKSK